MTLIDPNSRRRLRGSPGPVTVCWSIVTLRDATCGPNGSPAVTYGLIAAVAWGISTIAAAHAARRIGTYNAVLVSQVLGLTMLVVLAAILHPSLASVDDSTAGGLASW